MITIQLREDGAFVELEYNGIKSFRECDVNSLIDLLNDAVRETKTHEVIESPLLPANTIKFDRSAYENEYVLYMYREPVIDQIIFESREYNVGYPATIYRFSVRNDFISRISVWAIKDKVIRPDIPVYHYPFYNVFDDGKVCIGANRIEIEAPWQLHKVPDILRRMPSNPGTRLSNDSGLEGDSLFRAIENKPFPVEWLKPTNKTLKMILRNEG
jgi:hypothetical protein